MLGPRFRARALSSRSKRGPPPIAVRGPPTTAPHCCRAQAPDAVAHGPSRSAARGILPDQGSSPRPPHRQADSQPLRHQGSPNKVFLHNFLGPKFPISGEKDAFYLWYREGTLQVGDLFPASREGQRKCPSSPGCFLSNYNLK